jgi:hypothetical protein
MIIVGQTPVTDGAKASRGTRQKSITFVNASVVKESKKIKIYYNRERISPPLGGLGGKI